jgi:ABC-2 type transport system ATP-binding protein
MTQNSSTTAVTVSHLKKTYGKVTAVEDVSFQVNEGEIFGLLGPNGAGKTTTVECITGLRHPDVGTISVLGFDPQVDREALHPVVGVQLQFSTFPDKLKVGEILDMYQSFYTNPANSEELARALGFSEKLGSYYKTLSGGQKQRMSVALALIGQPKIAVLDEMTTGLDPQARLDTWELIEKIRDRGTTIILVTHYMEEAQRLCDRVALIDHGRIIALDTPYGLAEKVTGGKQVLFLPSKLFDDGLLTALPEVKTVEHQGKRVKVVGSGQLVNAVILALAQNGIEALDIQLEGATLEDAFVKLTGRHIH